MRQYLAIVLIVLSSAILAACNPGGDPPMVIIRWTTKSELNTAGFNLYRSDKEDGEYVKINPTLIPAKPDPILGGEYVYTDTLKIVAGQTYYYKLEDVEKTGATEMHGPIVVIAGRAGTPIR